MSRNDGIRVIQRRASTLVGFFAVLLILTLSGCENALVEAAKAIQAQTVSPIISLSKSDVPSLLEGGKIEFNQISVGSYCDIEVVIHNLGKSVLLVDSQNISLVMGPDTQENSFMLVSSPSTSIAPNESSVFILRFIPSSEGSKTATFKIPTNDFAHPSFELLLGGTGWSVILTTSAVTNISTTTATGGGNITNDGGVPVTSRGICWSTSPNPTIENDKQENAGVGTGIFTDFMTGLVSGNLYYVRAYASNGISTGYGTQVSFATLPAAPAVPTVLPVGYPAGSGKLQVSWPAVNGASIYDVYFSTTSTKTDLTLGSADLNTTSCTLSGLADYTPYYIWVIAKNATGNSAYSPMPSSPVAPGFPITGISLTSRVSILPTTTNQLTANITPNNATNPTITWTSNNSSIASISTTGMMTAIQVGNATITATTSGNAFTAQCLVAVTGIITLAGNGTLGTTTSNSSGLGTSISIGRPAAITTDKDGNVYFTDPLNFCVRKLATNGQMITIAGNGTDGLSTSGANAAIASLPASHGIMVDNDLNIFLSSSDQRIRKISPSGSFVTIAGNGAAYDPGAFTEGGLATSMPLGGPTNVVRDGNGNFFFSDGFRYRVRKIDQATNILSTICGTGVASFSGDNGPATLATIHNSGGIAIDAAGNIYLADASNGRIRKINTAGIISTIAGIGNYAGDYPWLYNRDGILATNAQLYNPVSVIVDEQGVVYFSDNMNSGIRKIGLDGIITTVAGNGTGGFSGDGGPATSAALNIPSGVALDFLGNLYIADTNNFRVRKVVR